MTSRAILPFVAACGIRSHAGFDAMSTDVAAVDASEPPATATFRNPLNGGPDPFMTQYDGQYYLLTTQGDALRIWKAASLADLAVTPPVTIWQDTDPTRDREVWAPAIYNFDGCWYVYYTADDGVDDHHRIYVIESDSDDAAGTYHFKAKLEPPGADLWAIDPVILEQASTRYVIWSGAGDEGHNLLYIAPMSDPWTVSAARAYLPAVGGCTEVREAPAVLQHGDTTFLVYSTCDTGKPDYQLWMMSIPMASDPMVAASWTQHPSPMFARDDATGVWGPGSNGFFKSPDGSEDWIVYHAKNTSQFTYDFRTTRAQRIDWNSGLPVLGTPHAAGDTLALPSGDRGLGTFFIDDAGTTSGPGAVEFSAGWTTFADCGAQCFRGGDHGSDQTGATATFRFIGTQIALYSARDAGNGIASLSLDGGTATTADYYAPIRQGEQLVYASGKLALGQHELRVTVTGSRNANSAGAAISIDRAEVYTD